MENVTTEYKRIFKIFFSFKMEKSNYFLAYVQRILNIFLCLVNAYKVKNKGMFGSYGKEWKRREKKHSFLFLFGLETKEMKIKIIEQSTFSPIFCSFFIY